MENQGDTKVTQANILNPLLKFRMVEGKRISVELGAFILIAFMGFIATITDSTFLSIINLTNILDSVTLYFLLASGLTYVLLSGSVNLAVGGMLSLNCVIFAMSANKLGLWGIPTVLICGFLEGIIVGMVFNRFKIPSFIATFGMMGIYTSLAVILSGGSPIVLSSNVMKSLRVLNMKFFGIKYQYFIVLLTLVIFLFLQKRTAFGKFIVAIGDSPEAVKHMGIDIEFVKMLCYGLSGLSTAIGSIILCSRLYSGDPTVGASYLLLIVAVVIVGGTSLAGGSGGIYNTLLGALTISVLQNALHIMGVNIYYHSIIIGIVMIIAVAISLDKEQVLVVK